MAADEGMRERIELMAAGPRGRWAITLVFSALYCASLVILGEAASFALAPCLMLFALAAFPRRRFQLIACTPLFWFWAVYVPSGERVGVHRLLQDSHLPLDTGSPWLFPAITLVAIFVCSAYRSWVEKLPHSSAVRRWAFFLFLALYLLAATLVPWKLFPTFVRRPCWLLFFALSPFLWYLGYDLQEKPKTGKLKGFERLALYRPFWMIYFVAPTKGEGYLRAVEAKNEQELARVQLKGLRLLWWAFLLTLAYVVYNDLLFASNAAPRLSFLGPFCLKIPKISDALRRVGTGEVYPPLVVWEAVYAEFFGHLLFYTIVGHLIVSTMRMAGFNALRNTYRPFAARSAAELFGRYNYYFKEALLHLFYYPVYLRFLRERPRARMVLATFASVGIGNLLIHFVRDINFVRELGTESALRRFLPYALYCFVLATVISISLLRQGSQAPRLPAGRLRHAATIFLLITFFAVLRIFDDTFNGDIRRNLALFAQLL